MHGIYRLIMCQQLMGLHRRIMFQQLWGLYRHIMCQQLWGLYRRIMCQQLWGLYRHVMYPERRLVARRLQNFTDKCFTPSQSMHEQTCQTIQTHTEANTLILSCAPWQRSFAFETDRIQVAGLCMRNAMVSGQHSPWRE